MPRKVRVRSPSTWRREAIRQMERSRAATLAFLRRLPAEEIVRPQTQGQWSIQDVLAHIAAWEEEGTRRLALIARGHADRMIFYDDMPAVDRFNARAVVAAGAMPLPGLLRRLARVRQRLIAALRKLPLRALNDSSHELPVVVWLREFAWTHERAHRREIREWWMNRRAELDTRGRARTVPAQRLSQHSAPKGTGRRSRDEGSGPRGRDQRARSE